MRPGETISLQALLGLQKKTNTIKDVIVSSLLERCTPQQNMTNSFRLLNEHMKNMKSSVRTSLFKSRYVHCGFVPSLSD